MQRVAIGVYIVLINHAGPWKIWVGDRYICPQCGHHTIADFGDPVDNYAYNKDFSETLKQAGRHQHYLIYDV